MKVWESPRHLRCWDLAFVLRDVATLDESRKKEKERKKVLKKVLFFWSIAPSSASLVLIRDKLLCSFIMAYTRWAVCGFSLPNTSTKSSSLHKIPPSIALHVYVLFESTASPLRAGGLVLSLWRGAGWRLSLQMVHSMFSLQLLSFRQAAIAESSCKKPFGPLFERFCTKG